MIWLHPRSFSLTVLFCLAFTFSLASAQEIQEQVEVQLVQVDVIATDSKGAMVTDLTADDFTLKEDGKVQKVTHFYNTANDEIRLPLTISFLVDTSGSMKDTVGAMTRIDIAKKTAELVINEMKKDDRVELIEFNKDSDVLVPMTGDARDVQEKLQNLNFKEASTSLRDAVVSALNRLNEQSGRRILVIFSDGMDTSSKAIEEDVYDTIHKADTTVVTFYTEFASFSFNPTGPGIGMGGGMKAQIGEDALRQFSEMSGGQFFSFRREPELLKAMEEFRGMLKSQYSLAYTPQNSSKKSNWRKLKVECKRKGVQLRYREGYQAN